MYVVIFSVILNMAVYEVAFLLGVPIFNKMRMKKNNLIYSKNLIQQAHILSKTY